MTTPASFDGPRLLAWARRGAAELDQHREAINSLNVFPVPDSDTGSNMAYTMAAAVREAEALPANASADRVAEALALGSVKGARGNSGVVLSQVLRGVAQEATEGELDARSIADALTSAVSFVERAISSPVEGTIITVLREAAAAAREAVEQSVDLAGVSGAALPAAEEALANTPSQLAELRDAGVVDAGGTGLVVLLAALDAEIRGGDTAERSYVAPTVNAQASTHGVPGAIEVVFMFHGPLDQLEQDLSTMGDSLVVARLSDEEGKVHIHSDDAGAVIERAYGLGAVSGLRLEVLPAVDKHQAEPSGGRLIVAVTPPGSLTELYAEAGARTIAPGPELMAELRNEIQRSGAEEILVLPNGQVDVATLAEIEHAVEQADMSVMLLPSVRLVNGIAALAVHDPQQPLDAAAAVMNEALHDMAVADIEDGEPVRVVGPEGLIAEDPVFSAAVESACRAMLADDRELITLLLNSADAKQIDAEALGESLKAQVLVYPSDGLPARGHIGVE